MAVFICSPCQDEALLHFVSGCCYLGWYLSQAASPMLLPRMKACEFRELENSAHQSGSRRGRVDFFFKKNQCLDRRNAGMFTPVSCLPYMCDTRQEASMAGESCRNSVAVALLCIPRESSEIFEGLFSASDGHLQ